MTHLTHKLLGIGAALLAFATAPAGAQHQPYRAVEAWGELPAGVGWGQTVGVDVDADGNVYALHRCGADTCVGRDEPPVLVFDSAGKLIKSWGSGMFVWPHGIHVDREGFVWVTDGRGADGRGHQVIKFSPEGEVIMRLGSAGVAAETETAFNGPTDVVVAANGDVFVADGHGNNRIVKLSADGRFLKAWGRTGSAPGEFDVPHGISMNSRGQILVADRGNSRIQVFDQDGQFIAQWTQFAEPSGVFATPADRLYVAQAAGIGIGNAVSGALETSIGHAEALAEAGNIEDIAADSAGNVYAGLADPRTLRKLSRD